MRKEISTSLYWGLIHGMNDMIAGFLLMHYTLQNDSRQAFMALLLYSLLAFAGQLPLGFGMDKQKNLKPFGQVAILLLILSAVFSFQNLYIAIILAGIASAGIHVIGGAICLQLNKEKITPLGIFTAPGIAGLAVGGFFGHLSIHWILFPALSVFVIFFLLSKNGWPVYQAKKISNAEVIDTHDTLMILLLLIMTLRSFIFDLINQFSTDIEFGLLILGLSAFAGKIIGAYLCDRIGWKRWLYISLPLAFVFFELGRSNIWALAFGMACLQSTVPLTLQLAYKALPAYPATAAAMSLGTVIAFAGLPVYGIPDLHTFFSGSSHFYGLLLLVTFTLLIIFLWKYIRKTRHVLLRK